MFTSNHGLLNVLASLIGFSIIPAILWIDYVINPKYKYHPQIKRKPTRVEIDGIVYEFLGHGMMRKTPKHTPDK